MTLRHVVIDRASPVPLYFQVSQQLEHWITAGELTEGDRLPNEVELAEQWGLSRPTMRRAIGELVDKGLVVRRRGLGTHVATPGFHRRMAVTSLYSDLAAAGRMPGTQLLLFSTDEPYADAADALGLEVQTELVHLERLRTADGQPIALLSNWFHPHLANLPKERLEQCGLYALLAERGIRATVASLRISARSASSREARLLKTPRGGPVLAVRRVAFDAGGAAIEFATHLYRADAYALDVTVADR